MSSAGDKNGDINKSNETCNSKAKGSSVEEASVNSQAGTKQKATEKGNKRNSGPRRTHVSSFAVFMRFIDITRTESGEIEVNVDRLFSTACLNHWLETRANTIKTPAESFRRVLTAHVRGRDERRPFEPIIEAAILRRLRRKVTWEFSPNIGSKGFRGKGYHEARAEAEAVAWPELAANESENIVRLENENDATSHLSSGTGALQIDEDVTNTVFRRSFALPLHMQSIPPLIPVGQQRAQPYIEQPALAVSLVDTAASLHSATELRVFHKLLRLCVEKDQPYTLLEIGRLTMFYLYDTHRTCHVFRLNDEDEAIQWMYEHLCMYHNALGKSTVMEAVGGILDRLKGGLIPAGEDDYGRPILVHNMYNVMQDINFFFETRSTIYCNIFTDLNQARKGAIHIVYLNHLDSTTARSLVDIWRNKSSGFQQHNTFLVHRIIILLNPAFRWLEPLFRSTKMPFVNQDIYRFCFSMKEAIEAQHLSVQTTMLPPLLGGSYVQAPIEYIFNKIQKTSETESALYAKYSSYAYRTSSFS